MESIIKLFWGLCMFCLFFKCSESAPYFSNLLEENGRFSRQLADDTNMNDPAINHRIREEDLRKLILKKLRFRDLDGAEENELLQKENMVGKRNEQYSSVLAHKVAALLNGLKLRQVKSPNVRMPSLRFG